MRNYLTFSFLLVLFLACDKNDDKGSSQPPTNVSPYKYLEGTYTGVTNYHHDEWIPDSMHYLRYDSTFLNTFQPITKFCDGPELPL